MKKKFFIILIGVISSVIAFLLFVSGLFTGLNTRLEDTLFSKRTPSEEIAIIAIDTKTLRDIGVQWPFPREFFAQLFLALEEVGPKAVGLDVIFADQSRSGAFDDALLSEALKQISYPLIMPLEGLPLSLKEDIPKAGESIIPRPEFLGPTVSLGHVNLILDRDGVARRYPDQIRAPISFFGTELDINAFSREVLRRGGDERELRNPIERIVYVQPPGGIETVSFSDAYKNNDIAGLKGKYVFIGATSPDLHDEKPTPFGHGTEMPGVEIQAQIANMLLQNLSLRGATSFEAFLFLLFSGILVAFLSLVTARMSLVSLGTGVVMVLTLGVASIYFEKGIALPIVHGVLSPLFALGSITLYRLAISEKKERELREVFSKYVSGDVLEDILRSPEKVELGGVEREVTVFFSDIRSFTTMSEKMEPTELVRVLNKYFNSMTKEVMRSKGVLDKYIGDAIMAFWGAPIEDPLQADHALEASIKMIQNLKVLNEELRAHGDPEIAIGIGLFTGKAIVGNIGSDERFDYTVIGDTVNTASRLEGLNKEYKTEIILGESTKEKLKGTYEFIPLGEVKVKGKNDAVRIYTIKL